MNELMQADRQGKLTDSFRQTYGEKLMHLRSGHRGTFHEGFHRPDKKSPAVETQPKIHLRIERSAHG
jgi:hypothetical protein